MSSKFGASRLTKSLRHLLKQISSINKDSTKLIGQDHLGNRYFEAIKANHPRPIHRYFERPKHPQSFDEIIEAAHVPPAWDAWLKFRRQEPPTEEDVMDGEEYFRMQQDLAASKKKDEATKRSAEEKKIPPGHFKKL